MRRWANHSGGNPRTPNEQSIARLKQFDFVQKRKRGGAANDEASNHNPEQDANTPQQARRLSAHLAEFIDFTSTMAG